jgi:hypothetical protein
MRYTKAELCIVKGQMMKWILINIKVSREEKCGGVAILICLQSISNLDN